MPKRGTLRFDGGREVRVEVVAENADRHELVVRETQDERSQSATPSFLALVDAHLASASRSAAGTTDRLLAADRDRPY